MIVAQKIKKVMGFVKEIIPLLLYKLFLFLVLFNAYLIIAIPLEVTV